VDADGKPPTCEHTWISYLTGAGEDNFTLQGKLTSGYGSMWGQDSTKPGGNIGPEFTFGLVMDVAIEEPVLIIKTAWGGKSLHEDRANADRRMSDEQMYDFLKRFEADLISPAEAAMWKRRASNAGYHYLGCAKTFAL
jgi:hypothetical protein